MRGPPQYCTFYVAGQCFGLEVLKVQEIIRYQEMTRVPLAPRVVRGLINMRGQIVTALDLRRLLEMPDRPSDHLPVNVVVHTDDGPVSLLVDEIGDVFQVIDIPIERRLFLFRADEDRVDPNDATARTNHFDLLVAHVALDVVKAARVRVRDDERFGR